MRRVGDFRDQDHGNTNPSRAHTNKETSKDKHSLVNGSSLKNSPENAEEEANVEATSASKAICSPCLERESNESTKSHYCINEPEPYPRRVVHRFLLLLQTLQPVHMEPSYPTVPEYMRRERMMRLSFLR